MEHYVLVDIDKYRTRMYLVKGNRTKTFLLDVREMEESFIHDGTTETFKLSKELIAMLDQNEVPRVQLYMLLPVWDGVHDFAQLELKYNKEKEFKQKYKKHVEKETEIDLRRYKHQVYKEKSSPDYEIFYLDQTIFTQLKAFDYGKRIEMKGIINKEMMPTLLLPPEMPVLFLDLREDKMGISVYFNRKLMVHQFVPYPVGLDMDEDMETAEVLVLLEGKIDDIVDKIESSALEEKETVDTIYVTNSVFGMEEEALHLDGYRTVEIWGNDENLTISLPDLTKEEWLRRELNEGFYVSHFLANRRNIPELNYMSAKVDKKYRRGSLVLLALLTLVTAGNVGVSVYSEEVKQGLKEREESYVVAQEEIGREIDSVRSSVRTYEQTIQEYNNYVNSLENLMKKEEKNYISNRMFDVSMNTPNDVKILSMILNKQAKYLDIRGVSDDYYDIGAYLKMMESLGNTKLEEVLNNELYNREGFEFNLLLNEQGPAQVNPALRQGMVQWLNPEGVEEGSEEDVPGSEAPENSPEGGEGTKEEGNETPADGGEAKDDKASPSFEDKKKEMEEKKNKDKEAPKEDDSEDDGSKANVGVMG